MFTLNEITDVAGVGAGVGVGVEFFFRPESELESLKIDRLSSPADMIITFDHS